MTISREVRLKSHFFGEPTADRFHIASVLVPPPADGEVAVRNLWMSVDPAMRGRMVDRPGYVPPFRIDEAMEGTAIGRVEASRHPSLREGDLVMSEHGWREAFTCPASEVTKVDDGGLPIPMLLGLGGSTGLAAYAGLVRVANIGEGETVFISAAAGAVGSAACLIAKRKGCRVIGSAGSAAKAAFLKDRIGVDEVITYKTVPKLTKALAAAAPGGIDVYFDNVGAEHLEAAIAIAKPFARLAICGMIASYNSTTAPHVPRNLFLIPSKRLKLEGFLVADHQDLLSTLQKDLRAWHGAGTLVWNETIYEGIDRSIDGLLGLFRGDNTGKTLIKLA